MADPFFDLFRQTKIMRSSTYSIRQRFGRTVIMIGIIACLCLSAGEGLRLRPFPVCGQAETEPASAQLHAERSGNHYLYGVINKYSPLIVPSRLAKRGKQLLVHYDHGSPSSWVSREVAISFMRLQATCEAERIVFLLLISRTPSRAPPLA